MWLGMLGEDEIHYELTDWFSINLCYKEILGMTSSENSQIELRNTPSLLVGPLYDVFDVIIIH